jgi:hypothetical protein
VRITAPPHRIPVGQAAAVWTLVFLIGLTGGELLRQTLDDPALAATSGPTEPTTATPERAPTAVAPSTTSTTTSPRTTTSTTTTPPKTTTMVQCDGSACPDHPGKQESRTEDGQGRGHGKDRKERGHGKDGKSRKE